MKILLCTNAFENVTNGPAKFANLILEINNLYPEHQVRILTEDCISESIFVYKVNLRIPIILKPLGQLLRMFIYYNKIKRIRNSYPFEIIVYNNSFTGLWASLISSVPTVGMINDEKNIRATLRNFQANRWWIKQFIFRALEKKSSKHHQCIITNSDFLKKKVMAAYRLSDKKVFRLYKSIDLKNIHFHPKRDFTSPVRILFVKADYRVGNLSVLADALAKLSLYKFILTVIGPEPQFELKIKALFATKSNITLNYLEQQPQQIVYQYLRNEDIFCVPSYTEALGVANIEALAHGISVISTQVGGIPEVLDHGNNGWLVPPSDSAALASAIQNCIEQSEQRRIRVINGYTFVKKFSKEVMFQEFLSILQHVVNPNITQS